METLNFDLIAVKLGETSLPVTIDTPLTCQTSRQAGKLLLKWGWNTEVHELRKTATFRKSMWLLDVFSKLMYFKENYYVCVQEIFSNIYIKKQLK